VLEDPGLSNQGGVQLSVLEHICSRSFILNCTEVHPQGRINYYLLVETTKKADNIDISMARYPMQIQLISCAAIRFWLRACIGPGAVFDLAQRRNSARLESRWLSFYFKSPMSAPALSEHDLLFS